MTDTNDEDTGGNPEVDATGTPVESPADGHATPTVDHANLSTEHQQPGDAKRPSETLDRDRPAAAEDGGRKSTFTDDA